ncbi:unnamed protein product [Urochloa humidicola]
MMQCFGGGTTSMLSPAAALYQQPCTYRDLIRRASVPGGLCRSAAGFFPASSKAAAGEKAFYYCWSSSSSAASSPGLALDSPARCSPLSLSFSSDDSDVPFSGCHDHDGVEELRTIALQMVHDGYMRDLIRAFPATGGRGLGPGPGELLLGSWFWELDVEWILLIRERDKVQPHLDLEDGCASLLDLMERWIKALKTMVQVLCITQLEMRAKTR